MQSFLTIRFRDIIGTFALPLADSNGRKCIEHFSWRTVGRFSRNELCVIERRENRRDQSYVSKRSSATVLTKRNDKTDEYGKRSRHRFTSARFFHILIYYLTRISVASLTMSRASLRRIVR